MFDEAFMAYERDVGRHCALGYDTWALGLTDATVFQFGTPTGWTKANEME